MYKAYTALKFALFTLIVPLIASAVLGSCISGIFFEGSSCSFQSNAFQSLISFGPWALLIFLILLILTLVARRDHFHHNAILQFKLFKNSEAFRPEDLGFDRETFDGSIRLGSRPFHETYISRTAAIEPADESIDSEYNEKDLADELCSGTGFVLVGQPLDGKSRTLFQILSGLKGRTIVAPALSQKLPDANSLLLIEGKDVVLLLEDLHVYVESQSILPEFLSALISTAASCVVAATCRDGPELKLVEQKLGRFYEDIPLKLKLLEPKPEDKGKLARGIGKEWDVNFARDFPTMGSVTMERHIEAMSIRFRNLLRENPGCADALRAMKLLTSASVGQLTHKRIEAVLTSVFGRRNALAADCMRDLANQSFLKSVQSLNEHAFPEPAYLRDAVTYTEGRNPRDDFFPKLFDTFRELQDAEALIALGVTSMIGGNWSPQAVFSCFDLATEIEPENGSAWLNIRQHF